MKYKSQSSPKYRRSEAYSIFLVTDTIQDNSTNQSDIQFVLGRATHTKSFAVM